MINSCDDEDLLVPDVENEAVTTKTNNCDESIDQGTQEDNTVAGGLKLCPMAWNHLNQEIEF